MDEALIETERGEALRGTDVIEPIRIQALVALFSGSFAPARTRLEEVSRLSSQAIGDSISRWRTSILAASSGGRRCCSHWRITAPHRHRRGRVPRSPAFWRHSTNPLRHASRSSVCSKEPIGITMSPTASVPPTRSSVTPTRPLDGCARRWTQASRVCPSSNAILFWTRFVVDRNSRICWHTYARVASRLCRRQAISASIGTPL